jgi:hypothetical protein
VRTHRALRRLAANSHAWLAEHLVDTETTASISVGGRAVVEFMARLDLDGEEVLWPLAVVAESRGDVSMVLRTYCSQWPVIGQRPVREPVLPPTRDSLTGVIARYEVALDAGDVEAVLQTFAPGGYVREPIGPHLFHRGADELRSYFASRFHDGGIGLQHCCVTDDGVRCAVEYNCVRSGTSELTPQAGVAVYERGADGLLAAVRIYDDVSAA